MSIKQNSRDAYWLVAAVQSNTSSHTKCNTIIVKSVSFLYIYTCMDMLLESEVMSHGWARHQCCGLCFLLVGIILGTNLSTAYQNSVQLFVNLQQNITHQ